VQVCLRVGADRVEGKQTWLDRVGVGWRMEGKRKGRGREEEGKRKEGRSYHDITPLLCCYVSEWCSSSLMLGAVQGGQSGGGGGVQGVRVSKVEPLDHCWGVDFSVGEPHVV